VEFHKKGEYILLLYLINSSTSPAPNQTKSVHGHDHNLETNQLKNWDCILWRILQTSGLQK
jgi:hypothetical protein